MKKILFVLMSIALCSQIAFADVTLYGNGTQKGRVENINVKGGTTSRSGQAGTIDMTALAGINWTAVGPIQNININWLAANIIAGASFNWTSMPQSIQNVGMNWLDIQTIQSTKTGINWQSFDTSSGGVNWTTLAGQAVQGQIMCWNQTSGRPGKCLAVSGNLCSTCN